MKKIIGLFLGCVLSVWGGFLDEEALRAQKERKLLLVNIESVDCPYCMKMKKEIFNQEAIRKQIDQQFIVVTFQSNDPSLPQDFRTQYLPANAILEPKHQEIIDAYMGYITPERFLEILNDAYTRHKKTL